MIPKKSRVKYLTNREILSEIHKSKCSFSSFLDKKYEIYDLIVSDLKSINSDSIHLAKIQRAKRIGNNLFNKLKASGDKKVKLAECTPDPDSFSNSDLVFRIMTFDHIPMSANRKKTARTLADNYEKVNFPPFQHWSFDQNNQLICVGKSHWVGGLENGHFSKDHGSLTETLGLMFMLLSDRYAQRGNWRGYTYVDEMKGQAILQLSQVGLQFDESKSENPFSYFTAIVNNSFTRILNLEKKNQNIRDDLLEESGYNPSLTRQSHGLNADENERQAKIYKSIKLPKNTDDEITDNNE